MLFVFLLLVYINRLFGQNFDGIIWMIDSVEVIQNYIDNDESLVTRTDDYDMTALMHASYDSLYSEVIALLIESGSDVGARDTIGMTALMYAAKASFSISIDPNRGEDVIHMLVDAGSDVDARDIFGNTALMYAAQYNKNGKVIEALVERGSNLDAINRDGETALILASISATRYADANYDPNYNADIIMQLLNSGASLSIRDANGNTAWDYIKNNNRLKQTDFYWMMNDMRFE